MKRILVLYRHPPGYDMRPAIESHLHALDLEPRDDELHYHNAYEESPPAWLRRLEFDAVVLHTTFLTMRWDALSRFKWRYRWVANLTCPKLAIPQDEYDHSEILDEWLFDWGVTDVFTNFAVEERSLIYPILCSRARFHECLTGYVDEELAARCVPRMRPLADRPNDIVYRASNLPFWFGSHGQLKHRIAEIVHERALAHGLRLDVSTRYEDVLYGDAWADFLLSGRAVIGAETGSSVLDRRGEVQARIRTVENDPALSFEEVASRMPSGWDSYRLFAIGPRHFEAVVTRTCQVLVAGSFSGILEAGRHYIAVEPDFSNLDEVLEQVRDNALLERITGQAYDDIYRSGRFTLRSFAAQLRAAIDAAPERPRTLRRAAFPLVRDRGPALERGVATGGAAAARAARAAAARLRRTRRAPGAAHPPEDRDPEAIDR